MGQVTGYGYNPDGQTDSITYPLPSTATWATTSTVTGTYDNADQLTGVTDFTGSKITIANIADGSASSIALKNSAGTTLQSFGYSDSPAGTVLTETDTPSFAQSPAAYTSSGESRCPRDIPTRRRSQVVTSRG